ncbi:hypothetical protein CA900_22985 [Escherichia coli]|nr:hypothetical protein CA900_22985 [Escherichia coli]
MVAPVCQVPVSKSHLCKIPIIHMDSDWPVSVLPKGIHRFSPNHDDTLAKLCHEPPRKSWRLNFLRKR